MSTESNNKTATKIPHVFGNVLRLGIPLTLRTITLENGTVETTDTDYIPSSNYPVTVEFLNGMTKYTFPAVMRQGNIAYVEDKGTLPIGCYAITVLCNDDNGDPRRFKQRCVVQVYDVTKDAGIEPTIEFEAKEWYLDAAVFIAVKGEDGTGIADISISETDISGEYNSVTFTLTDGTSYTLFVRNGESTEQTLPPGIVRDFSYVHTDNNYTTEDKERVQHIDNIVSSAFGDVVYDSKTKRINFYNVEDHLHTSPQCYIDASPFVIDGMLNNVTFSNDYMILTFNTDSGKSPIFIPISRIFNAANYYTKTQVDNSFAHISTQDIDVKGVKVTVDGDYLIFSKGTGASKSSAMLYLSTSTPGSSTIITYKELLQMISGVFGKVDYNSVTHRINFYAPTDTNKTNPIGYVDTTPFEGGGGEGTVVGVKMNNGTPIEPDENGIVDLGTVITSHQSLSNVFGKVGFDVMNFRINFYDKDANVSTDTPLAYVQIPAYYSKGEIDNAGYITTETDPTVPSWAKSQTKPTYTASEVGAVSSTGYVAYSTEEKNKLAGIEAGAEANVQADWEQTDYSASDFIKNKPTIPAAQVQSDWNATTGMGVILNKPTIPTVPTNVSSFTNDAGYLTSHQVITVSSNGDGAVVITVGSDSYTIDLNHTHPDKQDVLYDSTSTIPTGKSANFKTINNNSLLGSGNITLSALGAMPADTVVVKAISVNGTDVTLDSNGKAAITVSGGSNVTVDSSITGSSQTNPVEGGAIYTALSGKANTSEMSVTAGTGANADKTTIQLKSGTSATVLTSHQSLSGYAKYVVCNDETAYNNIQSKDSGTLYLIKESNA